MPELEIEINRFTRKVCLSERYVRKADVFLGAPTSYYYLFYYKCGYYHNVHSYNRIFIKADHTHTLDVKPSGNI